MSYGPFSRTTIGCSILAEPTVHIFGTDFRLGKSENLDSIFKEIVALSDKLTSITQVMVRFSRLLQLRLFNGLCPDFGIVGGLVF